MEDWSMSTVIEDLVPEHRYQRTHVECVRFDSFARKVGLRDAVVKADIEGGEARLLDGLASSGRAVVDFVCEVLQPAFETGFVPEAAGKLEADACLIRDGRLSPFESIMDWDRSDRNWLFTRRARSTVERMLRPNGLRVA
jgi:hypothetical protein